MYNYQKLQMIRAKAAASSSKVRNTTCVEHLCTWTYCGWACLAPIILGALSSPLPAEKFLTGLQSKHFQGSLHPHDVDLHDPQQHGNSPSICAVDVLHCNPRASSSLSVRACVGYRTKRSPTGRLCSAATVAVAASAAAAAPACPPQMAAWRRRRTVSRRATAMMRPTGSSCCQPTAAPRTRVRRIRCRIKSNV